MSEHESKPEPVTGWKVPSGWQRELGEDGWWIWSTTNAKGETNRFRSLRGSNKISFTFH